MTKVFVYGTLRSDDGTGNCRLMQRGGGVRLETGCTIEGTLHDWGHFPAVRLARGTGRTVVGEVWEVTPDGLAALDRYEGRLYCRRRVTVRTADGRDISGCEVYEGVSVDSLPVIASGDWLNREEG